MYLRLRHSILLALLVSAVSVLLYRAVAAPVQAPVVVVAPPPALEAPLPPLPPMEPLVPPLVERTRLERERIADVDLATQCARCDRELAAYRRHPDLASRTALELCVKIRCDDSDAAAQRRFESAVADLRERNTERACATLGVLVAKASPSSIWSAKAEQLRSRRCDPAPVPPPDLAR